MNWNVFSWAIIAWVPNTVSRAMSPIDFIMFLLWSAYSYLLHLCAFLWYTQLSTYEYTLSDVPLSDVLYCLRPVLAGPLINAPDVAKFDP